MKKKLRLVESKFMLYFTSGISWLTYSTLSLFNNPICSILASIILIGCSILIISRVFDSNEPDDEMSKLNILNAKSSTLDITKIMLCVVILIIALFDMFESLFPAYLKNININITLIISVLLGIMDLTVGFLFVKYEKDGK